MPNVPGGWSAADRGTATRATHRALTNAIRFPFGDQAASYPPGMSTLAPVPVADIIQLALVAACLSRLNTMVRPSGDQAGFAPYATEGKAAYSALGTPPRLSIAAMPKP